MQQYKKVIFTFDVPFKTVSVDSANDLQRFFEQLYVSDFNKFDLNKLLTDYSELTDSQQVDFNKNGIFSIVETSDTYEIKVNFKRVFDDSFSFSDSITRKDSTKGLTDIVSFNDSLIKTILKPFIDSVSTSDIFNKVLLKVSTDNITFSEILKKDVKSTLVSENIGMIDTLSISTQDYEECQVILSEQFIASCNKVLSDSIVLSETFGKNLFRSLTETIQLPDQKFYDFSKAIIDSVTGNDSGVISINTYIDPIYFSENYIGSTQPF